MGISKDHFKKTFSKLNIKQKRGGMSIEISLDAFGKKLDYAQDQLDSKVWRDIQLYMPGAKNSEIRTETNSINMNTRGEVYLYPPFTKDIPYGHYLYEGTLYVDPKTGSPIAEEGATKIPKSPYTPLFYPSNPMAEAHWDEVAYQNHHKEWVQEAKRAMK